jgi:hypothetical protein
MRLENVEDVSELFYIVAEGYSALTPKQVARQKAIEGKLEMGEMKLARWHSELLAHAGLAVRSIISEEKYVTYSQTIERLENREHELSKV